MLVHNEREEQPESWRDLLRAGLMRVWQGIVGLAILAALFAVVIIGTFAIIGLITLP